MCEKFQALLMEIFKLFTLYKTNSRSLCFTVRAVDSYKSDFIAVPSS